VEDHLVRLREARLCGLVERIVGTAGFFVRAHTRAHGALTAIRRQVPRFVLVDLDLPDEKGAALVRAIRRDRSLSRVRIYGFTGAVDPDGASDCDAVVSVADVFEEVLVPHWFFEEIESCTMDV
jgi:DNA-binding NtrC family response regulator